MEPRFTPTHLRALTLWPEWAFAIHHLDKRVENRTWLVPKDEWFMLHAGKYVGGKPGGFHEQDGMTSLREMAWLSGWTPKQAGRVGRPWSCVFSHPTHTAITAHDPSAPAETCNPILTSHILGAFRVTRHDAPYHGDTSGWRVPDQVGNVFEYRPLAAPVPCKGAQGLWRVPEEIRALLAWP